MHWCHDFDPIYMEIFPNSGNENINKINEIYYRNLFMTIPRYSELRAEQTQQV